jgi:hypothetical protein
MSLKYQKRVIQQTMTESTTTAVTKPLHEVTKVNYLYYIQRQIILRKRAITSSTTQTLLLKDDEKAFSF